MRSLPAAQLKTAGRASVPASTRNASAKRGCAFGEHRRVRPVEELRGGKVLGAGQFPIPGRVDDGQVVKRDRVGLEREATPLVDLVRPAEVDHRLQRDRPERLEVVGREPAEPVGPEQRSPAHRAAVTGRVAAEVAEVVHAVQLDVPGRREIGHDSDGTGSAPQNRPIADVRRMNFALTRPRIALVTVRRVGRGRR